MGKLDISSPVCKNHIEGETASLAKKYHLFVKVLYILLLSFCCLFLTSCSKKVKEISLSPAEIEVQLGGQIYLCPVITPEDAEIKQTKWKSSDTSVASVSADGCITGKQEGSTVITLTINESVSATCNVIVKDQYADSMYSSDKMLGVGDTIYFGRLEQDGDISNGPEPILWDVLRIDNDVALVCSHYIIDECRYDEDDYYWSGCYSRKYLNEQLLKKLFSKDEQSKIVQTTLYDHGQTSSGNNYGTKSLNRLFFLSSSEANLYSLAQRQKEPISTVKIDVDAYGTSGWWLRNSTVISDRYFVGKASYVSSYGEIDSKNKTYFSGVAPAMYLKLPNYSEKEPLDKSYPITQADMNCFACTSRHVFFISNATNKFYYSGNYNASFASQKNRLFKTVKQLVSLDRSSSFEDEDALVILYTDGTVEVFGDRTLNKEVSSWSGVSQIAGYGNELIAISDEGNMKYSHILPYQDGSKRRKYGMDFDKDGIKQICLSSTPVSYSYWDSHVTVLYQDGRVYDNVYSSEVSRWKDIVSIANAEQMVVGLKSDGTVLYAGSRTSKDIPRWKNIVSIYAGDDYRLLAIDKDGVIWEEGFDVGFNIRKTLENGAMLHFDVAGKQIVYVDSDGRISVTGSNYYGAHDFNWNFYE